MTNPLLEENARLRRLLQLRDAKVILLERRIDVMMGERRASKNEEQAMAALAKTNERLASWCGND